jgi:hypothetical protein
VDDHIARIQAFNRRQGIEPIPIKIKRKANVAAHPLGYMLDWYILIRGGAQSGMGHQPISYGEILAFDALMGVGLDTFDVETLRRLDAVWLRSRPKRDKEEPPKAR